MMMIYDAYLIDGCNGCRSLIAEGTSRSALLLARDLWNADRGNKRIEALFLRTAGQAAVDPQLTIALENKRFC